MAECCILLVSYGKLVQEGLVGEPVGLGDLLVQGLVVAECVGLAVGIDVGILG